jgi:hypothetical protein
MRSDARHSALDIFSPDDREVEKAKGQAAPAKEKVPPRTLSKPVPSRDDVRRAYEEGKRALSRSGRAPGRTQEHER